MRGAHKSELEQRRYIDDDFGPASRKTVWAHGNSVGRHSHSNPHHYLDEARPNTHTHYLDDPSTRAARQMHFKTSSLAQSTHHYIDDETGAAARRPVWAYGPGYVKEPTANPHHYLDYPRFAQKTHHYLDDDSTGRKSVGTKSPMTKLSGLEGQPAAPFGGQTFGKHGMRKTKMTKMTKLSGLEGQPAAPFGGQTFGKHGVRTSKMTKLSGLEGQPAAPFGGQTFGKHGMKKTKITQLSGLEGQPAAPFGGQTFGHTSGSN